MGYFANGSEGDFYEEQFCNHCFHGESDNYEVCPVLEMHMLWNYDAVGKNKDTEKAVVLNNFIPLRGDNFNDICSMFVSRECVS